MVIRKQSLFYRIYKTFLTKTILRLFIVHETINTAKLINRVIKWFMNATDLFDSKHLASVHYAKSLP